MTAGGHASGLLVALVCEQLLRDVPGEMGTYTRAMMSALPRAGAAVEPVVAWHPWGELSDAGVPHARRLSVNQKTLDRKWGRGKRPTVDGDVDVVHAPSVAFPPRSDTPLVVTVHDLGFLTHPDGLPEGERERFDRAFERIGDADLVIVPSEATARDLEEVDGGPEHVRVVPMGTDLEPPPDEERDRILDLLEVERPYVLWMGTIEPRKNPEGIVEGFVSAVQSWTRTDAEMKLYLVGPPGWWPQHLGEYVATHGMEDRIRRLDEQPKAYRAALYAGAEAFLYPSLAEGYGLPVLEAMACGTPVVTSNRSSLPEVAGAAALLCDPTDTSSIAEALSKVIRDRDLADDFRHLGRQRAAEFTWERTARGTVECYRTLLAGP